MKDITTYVDEKIKLIDNSIENLKTELTEEIKLKEEEKLKLNTEGIFERLDLHIRNLKKGNENFKLISEIEEIIKLKNVNDIYFLINVASQRNLERQRQLLKLYKTMREYEPTNRFYMFKKSYKFSTTNQIKDFLKFYKTKREL